MRRKRGDERASVKFILGGKAPDPDRERDSRWWSDGDDDREAELVDAFDRIRESHRSRQLR